MQAIILMGGLGTRMAKFTQNKIPKCLIEINNIPFIDYQLKYLKNNGIEEIVLCIGHLGEMIKEYVGNGSGYNLKIDYVEDGEKLCGTGGAIRKVFDLGLLKKDFLIIYGDSFLPVNFKEIYKNYLNQDLPAMMTVYKNNNKLDKSNVIFKNNKVFYDKYCVEEKFEYIDYGLTILNRNVIKDYIPEGKIYDLSKLFFNLSIGGKIAGYEVKDRFFEIGSESGLNDFIDWINNVR